MPTLALKSPTAHVLAHSGRFEVLLGPRGGGKRSLLRALAGLEPPADARVYFGGVEVTRASPARRPMTLVPRGGAAYPGLTPRRNLALALRAPLGDRRIDAVLAQLELHECADVRLADLEPRAQQLVALAKAAVGPAPAVLLDEPLTDLDSDARRRVRAFLREHVLAADRVLVLSSVDATEAMLLGGGVHVVDGGAVLQRGTPRSVSTSPTSRRVAELVHVPAFSLWSFRLAIEPGLGLVAQFGAAPAVRVPLDFSVLGPGAYGLGLPAHSVRLARTSQDDIEVRGIVRAVECLGRDALLRVEHDGGELAALVARDHGFVRRQALDVYFALQDAFVFTPAGKTLRVPATAESPGEITDAEASTHAAP